MVSVPSSKTLTKTHVEGCDRMQWISFSVFIYLWETKSLYMVQKHTRQTRPASQVSSASASSQCWDQDSVFLCCPRCPGTYSVDQAGLERRNLSASAYKVVGRTKGMLHHCPAVYYFSMPDESILVHFRVGLLVDFMLFFWRCGGLPPTQAQAWEINK